MISTIQSVEFLEGYVGRVYPLPKLDVVALPEFGIGGMENWGLITLREEFFFTDNTTDPADLTRNRFYRNTEAFISLSLMTLINNLSFLIYLNCIVENVYDLTKFQVRFLFKVIIQKIK